jgi:hypothetical protein
LAFFFAATAGAAAADFAEDAAFVGFFDADTTTGADFGGLFFDACLAT